MRRAAFVPVLALLALGCKEQTRTPADETPSGSAPVVAADVADAVTANMDTAANPCDDFYRYACGGWIDATELPADQPRYGRFQALRQRNQEALKVILGELAAKPAAERGTPGTVYAACMDEAAVESAGLTALQPMLDAVAKVDAKTLMSTAGTLRAAGVGVLFGLDVGPDYADPTVNIAHISQGGLGMPDRDYYLRDDEGAKATRDAYLVHLQAMFTAAGLPADNAKGVLAFETAIATATTPRAEMRDPNLRNNRITPQQLAALTPKLDWSSFFAGVGNPGMDQLNVYPETFFKGVEAAVTSTDAATLRAYLQWHLLHTYAEQLPKAFRDAHYAFYKKQLRGQLEPAPRWKDCVAVTDRAVRDDLGQLYVADHFAGDSRGIALEMITGIEAAFEAGLPSLSWMDEGTQARAVEKMTAIVNKIGYPQEWRDYSALSLGDGHLANVVAARTFDVQRSLGEYGKPVDKLEWHMSPPTVNAYYNPPNNEMVFPAGILQEPFFSPQWPMAMNFGGIGMVMGHELTHGFDDSGRKFDGSGRLTEWWDEAAAKRFEERAQCVDDLYSSYEVQPGVHLNGRLTLGENIADFGGIKQAHAAYVAWAQANGEDPKAQVWDGLTAEQLMFVSFGQIWCSKATPEVEKVLALTDPHSHPRYRINGPLSNLPAFWEAFSCEEGSGMRPPAEAVCEVW
ncbi:MAG: M13 family metallopeptidase [Myxococcota bacterium]